MIPSTTTLQVGRFGRFGNGDGSTKAYDFSDRGRERASDSNERVRTELTHHPLEFADSSPGKICTASQWHEDLAFKLLIRPCFEASAVSLAFPPIRLFYCVVIASE